MGTRLSRLAHAAAQGIEAVRHNARPFGLMQALAVALALAYYLVPGAPEAMAVITRFKAAGGLPFAALSTVLASVALPEIARVATGRPRTRSASLGFQVAFFALIGLYVDLFYQSLGFLFGNAPDFATVAKKLLVDQLVASTLITTPFAITAFLWKDSGFSAERTRNAFRARGGFFALWLPTMLTNWAYWAPILVAVYAMPAGLQFVLFLPIQAAWALLLVHLNER